MTGEICDEGVRKEPLLVDSQTEHREELLVDHAHRLAGLRDEHHGGVEEESR